LPYGTPRQDLPQCLPNPAKGLAKEIPKAKW
jgi:hypothetical protein